MTEGWSDAAESTAESATEETVEVDVVETVTVVAGSADEAEPVEDVVDVEDVEDDRDDRDDEGADDAEAREAAYEGSGDGALFAVAPVGGVAALASLPEPEVTGDARVDAATARLGELSELPASDHVAVYEDVHRRLQDALADAEVT